MSALAVRDEYGPTLGQLLAPRWHAASRARRVSVSVCAGTLLALALALALTLLNATYAHGGRVPFSFQYRGLYRVAPEAGGFVRVDRRYGDGALEYSFAVAPLRLPAYSGELTGEIPLYAGRVIEGLARRYPDFALRGEGR